MRAAGPPDGGSLRRVVPSPVPKQIFEHQPVRWLLAQGCVVICADILIMATDAPAA